MQPHGQVRDAVLQVVRTGADEAEALVPALEVGLRPDVDGAFFGIDLAGVRLEAADTDWSRGSGEVVRADSGPLVALQSGRTLPDGRALRRR